MRKPVQTPRSTNPVTRSVVWEHLKADVSRYIPLLTIDLMLAITQGNKQDATLMVLGYTIQKLDLIAKTDTSQAEFYQQEIERYRTLLQHCLDS